MTDRGKKKDITKIGKKYGKKVKGRGKKEKKGEEGEYTILNRN